MIFLLLMYCKIRYVKINIYSLRLKFSIHFKMLAEYFSQVNDIKKFIVSPDFFYATYLSIITFQVSMFRKGQITRRNNACKIYFQLYIAGLANLEKIYRVYAKCHNFRCKHSRYCLFSF